MCVHFLATSCPCPGPFEKLPCNAFAYCPDEVCFEPDAHHHTKGDCWLKFTEGPAAPEVRRRPAGQPGCWRNSSPSHSVAAGWRSAEDGRRACSAHMPRNAAQHLNLHLWLVWRVLRCTYRSTCVGTCRQTTGRVTPVPPTARSGSRACCCRQAWPLQTAHGALAGSGDDGLTAYPPTLERLSDSSSICNTAYGGSTYAARCGNRAHRQVAHE